MQKPEVEDQLWYQFRKQNGKLGAPEAVQEGFTGLTVAVPSRMRRIRKKKRC